MSASVENLRELMAAHGDQIPLDRALLAIAREEYPSVDEHRYLGRLDALAERATRLVAEEGDLYRALRRTLFGEEDFQGDGDNYYDPRNSLLNDVLDRRRGIPITLSVVYMEVARRAGGRAEGIGFPGHFLVQQEVAGRPALIDPFERGVIVETADCERMLESASGGKNRIEPWMLTPSTPRAMVARVLTNLKHAYTLQKDFVGAVKAIDRLLVVEPQRLLERRDRGLLYGELGLERSAITDLQAYLEAAPRGRDTEMITKLMPRLVERARRMN